MDGLYATHDRRSTPTSTRPSQPIRFWANKYKTKFNEDPTVFSVYGYIIDRLVRRRPRRRPARTSRPTASSRRWTRMTFPPDMFGSAESSFTADQAPGQRPVAPVADRGRQVEGGVGLRQRPEATRVGSAADRRGSHRPAGLAVRGLVAVELAGAVVVVALPVLAARRIAVADARSHVARRDGLGIGAGVGVSAVDHHRIAAAIAPA